MRSVSLKSLAVVALSLLGLVLASTRTSAAPRTLVLLDDNAIRSTHSNFFDDLAANGHQLSFVNVKEEMVDLKEHDNWLVDNVVVFAPSAEDLGTRTRVTDLVDFVDNGGSLLLASSSSLSEPLRALANHFGVDYDEDDSLLSDAAATLAAPATVELPLSSPVVAVSVSAAQGSGAVTGVEVSATVAFAGLGQMVTPKSRFVKPVIVGNPTTVAGDLTGSDISLVAAVQSLTGARALFAGSLALFSDAFYAIKGADNAKVGRALAAWAVHDAAYLRVASATHRQVRQISILIGISYLIITWLKLILLHETLSFSSNVLFLMQKSHLFS